MLRNKYVRNLKYIFLKRLLLYMLLKLAYLYPRNFASRAIVLRQKLVNYNFGQYMSSSANQIAAFSLLF